MQLTSSQRTYIILALVEAIVAAEAAIRAYGDRPDLACTVERNKEHVKAWREILEAI